VLMHNVRSYQQGYQSTEIDNYAANINIKTTDYR